MIYLRQMIIVCVVWAFVAHANGVSMPDFTRDIAPLIAKRCLQANLGSTTQHAGTAQQPAGSLIHRDGSVYPSLYPTTPTHRFATPTHRFATPARRVGAQSTLVFFNQHRFSYSFASREFFSVTVMVTKIKYPKVHEFD